MLMNNFAKMWPEYNLQHFCVRKKKFKGKILNLCEDELKISVTLV